MYTKIYAVDSLKESKGKNTEAWGMATLEHVDLEGGHPGIELRCSCYQDYGTGDRSVLTEPRSIRRDASVCLGQKDIAQLVEALISWQGLVLEEKVALRMIERLTKDLIHARLLSDESDAIEE